MPEEHYINRLREFLTDNPDMEWSWLDLYEVLGLPPEERTHVRRVIIRQWRAGCLPWLEMSTKRGRGGLGGLAFKKVTPVGEFRAWWSIITDPSTRRPPANTEHLFRLLSAAGALGGPLDEVVRETSPTREEGEE